MRICQQCLMFKRPLQQSYLVIFMITYSYSLKIRLNMMISPAIWLKQYYSFIWSLQGLNYITGLLLLITKDEESSFWLLKTLVDKMLPEYYSCSMPGLITDSRVLAELARRHLPQLSQHIDQLQVNTEFYIENKTRAIISKSIAAIN